MGTYFDHGTLDLYGNKIEVKARSALIGGVVTLFVNGQEVDETRTGLFGTSFMNGEIEANGETLAFKVKVRQIFALGTQYRCIVGPDEFDFEMRA